jgi:uncharacterized membrane protein HdeD (DUF308 family)
MSFVFAAAPGWGGFFAGKETKSGKSRAWVWWALRGVLAITLGALAFIFPVSAVFAFAMLFAAYALVDGFAALAVGLRHERRSWPLLLSGAAGIVTAVLFLLAPAIFTLSYAVLLPSLAAAWAIITGGLELAAAISLRGKTDGVLLLGISGLLSLLLGAAVLAVVVLNPLVTVVTTAWMIGAYALIGGAALIAFALSLRRSATTDLK